MFGTLPSCLSVQWGKSLSESFLVPNCVRKAGWNSITTSVNVYIDDLSVGLTHLHIDCNFNEVYVNHLIYDDDAILLAPSPSALQRLTDYSTKSVA